MEVIERFSGMSEDSREFIKERIAEFATGSIKSPMHLYLEDNGNDKVLSDMCINILNNEIRVKQYKSWAIWSSALTEYDRLITIHTNIKMPDNIIYDERDIIRENGYKKKRLIFAKGHIANLRDPGQMIWKHRPIGTPYAFVNDIGFNETIQIINEQNTAYGDTPEKSTGYMLYCGPEYNDRIVLYYVPTGKQVAIYDHLENSVMENLILHELQYSIIQEQEGQPADHTFENDDEFEKHTGKIIVLDHYMTPALHVSGMGGAYIMKEIKKHIIEYILLNAILELEKEDFEKFIEYLGNTEENT